MKRFRVIILSFLFAGATLALGQGIPALINYQGRLTDAAGVPLVDGAYRIDFKLWNDPASTSTNGPTHLIWGNEYGVTLIGGTFNVILGAGGGTPVPGAAVNDLSFAFGESNRFFGLTITQTPTGPIAPAQQREILPRQQLLSVPFAVEAQTADLATTIPDGIVTSAKLGSDAITTAKILDGAVTSAKIGTQAIATGQLQDGSVTELKLAPTLRPKTLKKSVSPLINAVLAGGNGIYVNAFTANGPGLLRGITLKGQNPNGAATFTLKITVDGTSYTFGLGQSGTYSKFVATSWSGDPPVLSNPFTLVSSSAGTAFDLNVSFNTACTIDLRVDSNTDGRNGFYVATSYEN